MTGPALPPLPNSDDAAMPELVRLRLRSGGGAGVDKGMSGKGEASQKPCPHRGPHPASFLVGVVADAARFMPRFYKKWII